MTNPLFESFSLQSVFTFIKAFCIGTIPSIIWLMFWLREDSEKPEPRKLLLITFILGMFGVLLVIPLQKIVSTLFVNQQILVVVWAFIEEAVKCLLVILVVRPTFEIEQPIDYAIYLIVGGLGFAALENTLYILKPVLLKDNVVVFLTGNLRFMGSTLLHATASGLVGIVIGLSFFQNKQIKYLSAGIGLILATLLHSTFNFFIMKGEGKSTLQIFIFLWVFTTIIILLFEKLRRMSGEYDPREEEY